LAIAAATIPCERCRAGVRDRSGGTARIREGVYPTDSISYFIPGTPLGNLLFTTGHSAWKQSGEHPFEAFTRVLVQDADTGAALGTDNVRLSLTLDQDAGTLTGTFKSQIKNTAGSVLLTITGDYSATPITV
jgi:hypothetical protein